MVYEQVHVHYGQFSVLPEDVLPDVEKCFQGQRNGLCGAATPGALFLITGLHTGLVGLTVELHDERPALADEWEEAVEVSFVPAGPTGVVGWGGAWARPLDLVEAAYRVRYCGSGMDAGSDADTRLEGQAEIDRYLLQFWPEAAGPDVIVRCTGANARYWHDEAHRRP